MHILAVLVLLAALTACRSARPVVARAGTQELTVEQLARIFAQRPNLPLRPDMGERVANWWVEYQLLAQRLVSGDSLLDSATVVEAMWPDARKYVVERWREALLAPRLPLESASVDSAYQAGHHRLIQHVLMRADSTAPPELKDRRRAQAQALRARLAQGQPWESVNRENEDAAARERGGSVGVIGPGQTPAAFEGAAFGLRPGEISPVVASPFGFHILRRPTLSEVREEYRAGLEAVIAEQIDSINFGDLARRRHLTLREGALQQVRRAVSEPLRFKDSRTVVATFDGGRFTLGDVVGWLLTIPDRIHSALERGPDRQLAEFLDAMTHYQLTYFEAVRNHVTLSPEEFLDLKDALARRLNDVKAAIAVYPPAPGDSSSVEERQRRASEKIEQFLLGDWERFARVPAFLDDRLRRESRWAVYPRGIDRSLKRASELRAAGDSLGR